MNEDEAIDCDTRAGIKLFSIHEGEHEDMEILNCMPEEHMVLHENAPSGGACRLK